MNLPIRLINFWYPESFVVFLRILHNTIFILEEDLAVGLMFKFLFVPLFHDSSIVGKILSFVFRLSRIFFGLSAFLISTIFILAIALVWFLSPFFLILALFLSIDKTLVFITGAFVLVGFSKFVNVLIDEPRKKIWQVQDLRDLWLTTKLKQKNISWSNLLKSDEVKNLIASLELAPEEFSNCKMDLNSEILAKTLELGKIAQARFITSAYFWLAMLEVIPGIQNEMLKFNLTMKDFEEALSFLEFKRNKWRKVFIWDDDFAIKHLKGVNRGWLSAPTPFLDSVSYDLTREASMLGYPDFVGQNAIVSEVISILSQPKDRSVLLVGSPGSGKSALIKYLAKLIIVGNAPESLAIKRLVALDLTKLLSGVTTEGELAEKVKNVFEDVKFVGDIIIFVDELHNLGIGEAGLRFNLYSLLQPYLESNFFQFIATTENENYARIIEKNSSFARVFHKVELAPASLGDTIQILKNQAIALAREQGITVTYTALKEIVILSVRLIHDRVLPDSALSVLDECIAVSKDRLITSGIVKGVFANRVNVPILELDSNQKDELLNLEDIIHTRLIDQEEAVKAVSNTLRRSATALRESSRPIGSFLFVGPTGVGKTELAKTLSEVYFKNSAAFIRFDMSEYQTTDAIVRLIGNQDNPGELTEAIKNKPYALILLDEFEKANPQLLTIFLQVLEDGRLTDATGKTIDFSNTIIIATSNAASLTIARGLSEGQTLDKLDAKVRYELLKIFKPELINRFDSIVIFKPLSEPDLEKIVKLKLDIIASQMKEQGYLLEFSAEVINTLAKRGFDPVMGARPLRRLMQDTLESNLSKLILQGDLKKGDILVVGMELLN